MYNIILCFRFTPEIFYKVFSDVVRETIAYRKSNKVRRNDFLQYILDSYGKDSCGICKFNIFIINKLICRRYFSDLHNQFNLN